MKQVRLRLKCDGTRAETRFRLSAKRSSPFKSVRGSVQSTTGNRGVRVSGSNAGYTTFRDSVKSTGYPLHSPVSPSLPLPCVTVCHHISTGPHSCGITVKEPTRCTRTICTNTKHFYHNKFHRDCRRREGLPGSSPYNRPLRPRGGVEVQLYSFINLGARWGGWSAPRPGRFTSGKDPVPIV